MVDTCSHHRSPPKAFHQTNVDSSHPFFFQKTFPSSLFEEQSSAMSPNSNSYPRVVGIRHCSFPAPPRIPFMNTTEVLCVEDYLELWLPSTDHEFAELALEVAVAPVAAPVVWTLPLKPSPYITVERCTTRHNPNARRNEDTDGIPDCCLFTHCTGIAIIPFPDCRAGEAPNDRVMAGIFCRSPLPALCLKIFSLKGKLIEKVRCAKQKETTLDCEKVKLTMRAIDLPNMGADHAFCTRPDFAKSDYAQVYLLYGPPNKRPAYRVEVYEETDTILMEPRLVFYLERSPAQLERSPAKKAGEVGDEASKSPLSGKRRESSSDNEEATSQKKSKGKASRSRAKPAATASVAPLIAGPVKR